MAVQIYEKDFPIYSLDFIKSNKHWISAYGGFNGLSPYYAEDPRTGLTIPNCVPMVYGYWHCMGECTTPKELKLSPYNANSFFGYPDGYERSTSVPKVGAIICWKGGSDGYGHVAIVTKVRENSNGTYTINTLNSAYKSTIYYERELTTPFNFRSYVCQGFIYCPFIIPDPAPQPTPSDKFEIGDDVVVDGPLYKSSNATVEAGYADDVITKVTRKNPGSAHPYNTTGDLGWCDESSLTKYVAPTPTPDPEPTPEPTPEPEPAPTYKYKIGDRVIVTGDLYRASYSEEPAGYIKDKVTTITRLAEGAPHPYNTTGDLGWMDEDSIKPYEEDVLKVGDKVEPITNKQYNGRYAVRWDEYYYITELQGDRAVLSAKRGNKMVVWCAMNVNNLRKVD